MAGRRACSIKIKIKMHRFFMLTHQAMASSASNEQQQGGTNYRLLINDIATNLTKTDAKLLVKIHRLELDQSEGLDPEPGDVLQCMEDKGIFSARYLETLSSSLKRLGRRELAELVVQFEGMFMCIYR